MTGYQDVDYLIGLGRALRDTREPCEGVTWGFGAMLLDYASEGSISLCTPTLGNRIVRMWS